MLLERWCARAQPSRLAPFVKCARTMRQRRDLILNVSRVMDLAGFGLGWCGGGSVGDGALIAVGGAGHAEGFVGSDRVEDLPVVLGFDGDHRPVGDFVPVEMLVFQGAVRRSAGKLKVRLPMPPGTDRHTGEVATVRVAEKLRTYDPSAAGIDIGVTV